MKFSRRKYKYTLTITHAGSIFAFSAQQEDENPQAYSIGYSLLSLDATQSEFDSWKDFKLLDFSRELRPVGYNLITISFKKDPVPAVDAPFSVYSDGTHVYVFRQSSNNTLLVDRFVFDQSLGVLNNAWEVRYRRSQKIDTPADRNDTFGSMNMNGERFIEPTTELTMIGNLAQGRFAAWVLPTELAGVERWLILAYNSYTAKMDFYSIARSQNGLFDLTDAIDPVTHKVLPDSQITLQLNGNNLSWESGPVALLYSKQERLKNEYGEMSLLKKEVRLMMAAAVGPSKQIAILDFGVGKNGRIAQAGNLLPVSDNPPVGTCLSFDRSQATAGLLPQLGGTSSNTLTVECWINPRAFSGGEDFVITANQNESFNQVAPFSLVLKGSVPQFTVTSAGTSASVQGEPLQSKFWHHLAGVWDGVKATLYVNGQPFTAGAQAPQILPAVTSGYLLGGATGFTGDLKELRLWKIPLNRQMILAGMNQPINSSNPNWNDLIGYWTLNEPSAADNLKAIPNSSFLGTQADGERSGAPWAATNAPVGASMAPVAWDSNGLSVVTALLTYTSTDQTPALLAGADGLVHLYYRDASSGVFTAAQFDTTTARAHYRTRWLADDPKTPSNSQSGTLRFIARQAGSPMNNPSVQPEYVAIETDSIDPLLCTITLLHYTGLKEVWPKVSRNLDHFLQIINGDAIQLTTDPAAIAEGYVMYDYHLVRITPGTGYPGIVPGPGTGSGIFSVMADTLPSNGMAALVKETAAVSDQPVLVRAGADCWWIKSPPIATLKLAGEGDSITIFDQAQIKTYKGDLNLSGNVTLECWINPSSIPIADPDMRILVFNNPDHKASYTIGLDDLGRPFAGTHDFSSVAQAYQIGLNRWTHLAAAYKTDFGIHLSGTQYLDAGDDTSLSSSDAVTIEAWVKLDQNGQRQIIASKWDDSTGQSWQLYVGADNVPAFDVMQVIGTNTRIVTAKAPKPIAKNEWHHVAGVYDVAYKQQTAIQFQALDQSFVTIPQLTHPPETAVTVEAWVYLLNPTLIPTKGTQIIVYTADPNQKVLFYLELTDYVPKFTVESGSGKSIEGPSALPFESWVHLAGTWDEQGNVNLYINGISVSGIVYDSLPKRVAADALAVPAAFKAIYSIGGFGSNLPFNGWINELRFWNRALPVNDVRHNMNLQLSGGERGLVGYWPFQDRFGTTAMDLAGTSNGALTNATYIQVQKGAFTHKVLLDSDVRPGVRVEEPVNMSDTRVLLGTTMTRDFLQATIDDVRLWKVGRMDWEILYYMNQDVPKSSEGLLAKWTFETGHGYVAFDSKGDNNAVIRDSRMELTDEVVDAMWVPTTFLAGWTLYVNGDAVSIEPYTLPASYGSPQFQLGAMTVNQAVGKFYKGFLNEIRVWNQVRTAPQIQQSMYRPLTGAENGLVGYWPVSAGSGEIVGDATGAGVNGVWAGIENANWSVSTAPVATEAPIVRLAPMGVVKPTQQAVLYGPTAGEYGIVIVENSGALSGAMNRAYFFIDPQQALNLIPGYNVGELNVQFVGQVQTQPTLIGYIEGPPPVPAENLMLNSGFQNYYVGTSSLALTLADQVAQVYTTSRDTGFDMRVDAKLGGQFESRTEAGLVVSTLLFGFISKIGVHTTFEHSLGWLNDATLTTSLNLNKINSVRIVGSWQKNTYAVNDKEGEMYFPNNQGYALVNSGTADLYALRLKDTGALVSYTMIPNPDIPIDVNVIPFPLDPHYVKNGTLDGYIGFEHEDCYKGLAPGQRGSYFKPLEAYALKQQIEREYQQMQAVFDEFQAVDIGQRANVTQFTAGDIGSGNTDLGSLLAGVKGSKRLTNQEWKKEIARRNLVNTYVWTAEGGFYAEEEQFSAVREDSMGGSYDFSGLAGLYTEMGMSTGIHFELDALFGGHIRTRAVKTQREGVNFGLSVDVNGERFINRLKLGEQHIPIPGKVKGYRFMSFYMSPSKRNFEQFKGVVDQDWLNGQGSFAGQNDPNAFALRQALTRPNEVWRVLHRVTYVSRVPDTAQHDEGESIGLDVLRPSAEMNATNALLLAQLPKTADTMGPVSVALTTVLSTLEQNSLWGNRLAAEEPEVRSDIMQYMRGYYGI